MRFADGSWQLLGKSLRRAGTSKMSSSNESLEEGKGAVDGFTELASPGVMRPEGLVHARRRLGTYSGVLIPTCENMWGVLIFLRFFYIVGNAGVWQSYIIAFLSFMCALLTTMSLSAIATNGPVQEGGTYFFISRALGPRLGGAVGCIYYLGLVLLAVLEVLGAVEVFVFAFPSLQFPSSNRIIGAALLLLLGTLVYFGISFVSRLGIVFFLVVLYTMLSYYMGLFTAHCKESSPSLTGLSWNTFKGNWNPSYEKGVSFSVAVSLFFPCFTGILSGADRANHLKKPEKSIPAGTLGAIFISLVMYLSYLSLWAAVGTREYLLSSEKLLVVEDVAFPSAMVTQIGIIFASLSQALQCLVTSPRLLQAIADDKVLPLSNILSKTSASDEPRRALLWTTGLCMVAAMIGSLDVVAPLVSICFLTCYSALNLSCFVLSVIKAPSWRPTWKYYHWSFALLGFILCAVMSFVILWYWGLVSVILLVLVYSYIDYHQVEVDWGTGLGGLLHQLAVKSILSAGNESRYTVNWRPQLLCLCKPRSTWARDGHAGNEVLALASQLKKGRGLCIVTVILAGDLVEQRPQIAAEKLGLENSMEMAQVTGFARIFVAPSYRLGKTYAIQSSGLGSLEPNTLVIGWPQKWREPGQESSAAILLETLTECKAMDKAVLLCMNFNQFPTTEKQEGFIDIWWIVHDGGLLLLLSYLLTRDRIWKKCTLRVHTVAEKLDNSEEVRKNLKNLLAEIRISAEVEVLEIDDTELAPYTFDYTIRVEEARAFAEQVASYRKTHDDKPSVSKKTTGHDHNLKGVMETPTSEFDQHAVVFKDTVPAEISMIEGAGHTPRGYIKTKDVPSDNRHQVHLSSPSEPSQQMSSEILTDRNRSLQRNDVEDVHDTSPGLNAMDAEGKVPSGDRREKATRFAEVDSHECESRFDVAESSTEINLECLDQAGDQLTAGVSHVGNGGSPSIMRTGSAGQLLYPGSSHMNSSQPLPVGLEPLKRTWETFSQNYSPRHLNDYIVEQSKDAKLVLINLPDHYSGMEPARYMQYCEELTQGLSRVLFVRGTGKELWSGSGLS